MTNSTPNSTSIFGAVFPNELIDPKDKDYKYIRDYAKAMYFQYMKYNSNIGYINRAQYEINRMYAMGMQDIDQYKNQIDIGSSQTDGSYLNIDYSPLAIGTKYHNLVKGMMSKNTSKISATAVNPLGIDKKTQARLKDTFNFLFKDEIAQFNEAMGNPQPVESNYTSIEDIELYYEHDYKLVEEEVVVDAWNIICATNDWKQVIKEQLSEDLFDYGICGTRDYVDSNGTIKIRRVNPENLIIGWSDRPDFKDCPHFGEIVYYTISELRQRTSASPQQISEEEWEKLAKTVVGGNYSSQISSFNAYNYSLTRPYDVVRVPVMDFEFESVNRYEYEKLVDETGNVVIVKADPTVGTLEEESVYNKKRIRKDIKVLYTGLWVVNTDIIFDAGLSQNLKRSNESLGDTMSNYHLYAPTKKGMRVKSMMEYCIPMINNIHISWYKLQAALAKARPKGIAIDIAGISGITKGTGGVEFSPLEIIEIYDATGNILYRSTDDNGRPLANGRLPLQEVENGMANDVFKFVDIINQNQNLIYQILGFNEISAGSNPNPEVGKAQSEMALSATSNALQPLYTAYSSVLERTAKSCIQRLQDISINGTKGYEQALGTACMAALGAFPDLSLWDFGIIVEAANNEEDIEMVKQLALNEASVRSQGGAGGITLSDYLMIKDVMKYNPKKAARLLDNRKKKQALEDSKLQQANSQANSEAQAQASQQAMEMQFQMKQMELEMQSRLKLELGQALQQQKDDNRLVLQEMVNETLERIKEMDVTGKVIVADTKSHHDDNADLRKHEYSVLMQDMKHEHEYSMKPKE